MFKIRRVLQRGFIITFFVIFGIISIGAFLFMGYLIYRYKAEGMNNYLPILYITGDEYFDGANVWMNNVLVGKMKVYMGDCGMSSLTLTVFPGEYTIVVKKEDIIVREKVKIENIPKAEYYVVVKKRGSN